MGIADDMQIVAMIAGLCARIVEYPRKKITNPEEEISCLYVQTYAHKNRTASEYEYVPYKGKVWCPTTDAGFVIFREENKAPYITGNSVFWNLAYYDEPYFKGMFEDFVFPDGDTMQWESVSWLQKLFMKWFNRERTKQNLTFPVKVLAA